MCWVQRKKDKDALKQLTTEYPRDMDQRKLKERLVEYERIVRETEDEMELVKRALSERQLAISTLHLLPKELSESESEEEEFHGDYLESTNIYLKHRPQSDALKSQLESVTKQLGELLSTGIEIASYTKEKKGAFGRKKKAKLVKCFFQVSTTQKTYMSETKVKWGPTNKKLSKEVSLADITTVLYGYRSKFFQTQKDSPTRDQEWTCFTVVTGGEEHDFVIKDDAHNLAFACVLISGMTLSKWRWIRIFGKSQLNRGDMMGALNKLARADDVEVSEVSDSGSEVDDPNANS